MCNCVPGEVLRQCSAANSAPYIVYGGPVTFAHCHDCTELSLKGDCHGQNQKFFVFKYCLGHVQIIKMIKHFFLLALFWL